jgi:hypothetical protein
MSSRADTLRPPSGGTPPRATAVLANGTTCFLAPLAHDVARRHLDAFPDEADRYGPAGLEWCAHDVQWILAWASSEAEGQSGLLSRQLAWLGDLLAARGYPRERLARAVELCADVVDERHPGAGASLSAVLRAASR